jgi:hypothetical protein
MKKFLTEPELISEMKKNLISIEEQFDSQKIFDAVENIIINLSKK